MHPTEYRQAFAQSAKRDDDAGAGGIAVLDTNVVLDWLVFADPRAARWARAIESGAIRWVRTAAMADELGRVLEHAWPARWLVERGALTALADGHACCVAAPSPQAVRHAPRCADPDDQMFIDLAIAVPARWLLTRDRALLRLGPQARRLGIEIVTPSGSAPPPG